MIHLHINPARVEQVLIEASSDLEEDFDLAAWPLVRPFVHQLNRRLGRAAAQAAAHGQGMTGTRTACCRTGDGPRVA